MIWEKNHTTPSLLLYNSIKYCYDAKNYNNYINNNKNSIKILLLEKSRTNFINVCYPYVLWNSNLCHNLIPWYLGMGIDFSPSISAIIIMCHP